MNFPELPNCIGNRGKRKNPDGSVVYFIILDEIRYPQSNTPHKYLVLQKISFDTGEIQLRFGYYIIGKKPRSAGKWVWGQFAPLIPIKDFIAIYEHAKEKGWLSFPKS